MQWARLQRLFFARRLYYLRVDASLRNRCFRMLHIWLTFWRNSLSLANYWSILSRYSNVLLDNRKIFFHGLNVWLVPVISLFKLIKTSLKLNRPRWLHLLGEPCDRIIWDIDIICNLKRFLSQIFLSNLNLAVIDL